MHNDFFPFDGTDVWADVTLDWALQGFVRDSDGDGYRDDVDAFIYNPNEWIDADGDGVGANTDECDNDPMIGGIVTATGTASPWMYSQAIPTSGSIRR